MYRKKLDRTSYASVEGVDTKGKSEMPEMRFNSENEFHVWRIQTGFIDGFHGTFRHDTGRGYLYVKRAHHVETQAQAIESLSLLREFTRIGILYPSTIWGSYLDSQGGVQLFALTPTLLQDREGPRRLRSYKQPDYKGIFDEGSHILNWYRRLDPHFDPKVISEMSPVLLLNPWEASYSDNWGWDETGTLYPIDVEVIDVSGSNNSAIIHRWYESQQHVIS